MNKALLLAAALLAAPAVACDASDDTEVETEYQEQAEASEFLLEDALTSVDDEGDDEAVIVDAEFELGVDSGFYTVQVVEGEDLVVYEVDAVTGERVRAERRRAERAVRDLARDHRSHRRRLAALVREIREEHRARAVRARLEREDAVVDVIDREGVRHSIRRRLAAAGADETRRFARPEEDRDEDRGRG